MPIDLDTTLWPIPITRVAGELRLDDLERFFDRFVREVIEPGERFVSVVDVTEIEGTPSAAVREAVARWLKGNDERGVPHGLGYVIAMRSALVRGAMTAVHWLNPPAGPTKFVSTRGQAVRWAVSRLEETEVAVDPAIYGYLEALEQSEARRRPQVRAQRE